MTQEALKLALECAERCEAIDGMYSWSATITALKEALAQTEQEPVRLQCVRCGTVYADGVPPQVTQPEQEPVANWSDCSVHSEPAYLKGECDCGGFATPPQRTWVGLTDEDRLRLWIRTESEDVDRYAFAKAIEAKLKEKNT